MDKLHITLNNYFITCDKGCHIKYITGITINDTKLPSSQNNADTIKNILNYLGYEVEIDNIKHGKI